MVTGALLGFTLVFYFFVRSEGGESPLSEALLLIAIASGVLAVAEIVCPLLLSIAGVIYE